MSTSSWLRPPQLSVDVGQRESHWYMKNITHLRSPCLPLALVARSGPLVAECAVCLERTLLLGDLARCLLDVTRHHRYGPLKVGAALEEGEMNRAEGRMTAMHRPQENCRKVSSDAQVG